MKKDKEDRRIKYTKMVLRQALLDLMKDQPIHRITVTDICRKADVNRNTFYAHYSTPADLLARIEDDLFDEVDSSISRSLKPGTITALITELLELVAANRDLCSILFSESGNKDFLRRIMYIASDRSLAEWKTAARSWDDEKFDKLYVFVANGSLAVIQHWIQAGMRESPQEVARFIEKVSSNGVFAFLK